MKSSYDYFKTSLLFQLLRFDYAGIERLVLVSNRIEIEDVVEYITDYYC